MKTRSHTRHYSLAQLAGILVLATVVPTGCNRGSNSKPTSSSEKPDYQKNKTKVEEAPKVEPIEDPTPPTSPYKQSFAQATRTAPPDSWQPFDRTMTGKSVGRLFEDVKKRWDSIQLINAEGKPLSIKAILETDLGTIEITLLPEIAPNHVRNFIALAQAGFYDGLIFELTEPDGDINKPEEMLHRIEGGCPVGKADSPNYSLGYWLKAETSKEVLHDVGVVGASHNTEEDTAACRFYITLSKAPYLDGAYTIFGKVSKGLDVANTIAKQPVVPDKKGVEYPQGQHPPVKPVVIKKVMIVSSDKGK